ncbi:MAG TPA: hypothetical protein ENJ10_12955, partial [Caldithrix abyssi]|nr:hypothetical protein [Caldithrix abyssi]
MFSLRILLAGLMAAIIVSCQQDSPLQPDKTAENIDAYVENLQYNSEQLLNVQPTGESSQERSVQAADTTTESGNTQSVTCIRTTYDLKQNFDDIAIL